MDVKSKENLRWRNSHYQSENSSKIGKELKALLNKYYGKNWTYSIDVEKDGFSLELKVFNQIPSGLTKEESDVLKLSFEKKMKERVFLEIDEFHSWKFDHSCVSFNPDSLPMYRLVASRVREIPKQLAIEFNISENLATKLLEEWKTLRKGN